MLFSDFQWLVLLHFVLSSIDMVKSMDAIEAHLEPMVLDVQCLFAVGTLSVHLAGLNSMINIAKC